MAEVEFFGESFQLTGEFSEFALMEFAEAAEAGTEAESLAGMAAMLRLVLDCVSEDQRGRFRQVARKNRSSTQALLDVLGKAMEAASERPTGQPSVSSDGPIATAARSEPSSTATARVVEMFPGRPDKQAMALQAMGESVDGELLASRTG